MVATQDIKRGTRILSEKPILTVDLDHDNDQRLLGKFLRLSQSEHAKFTELSSGKQKASPEVYNTFATELEKYHQYSGRYLAAAARDFSSMYAIFYSNCVTMGSTSRFAGVFPVYSRLNHSCTPNVQNSYNKTLEREVVYAIRDIEKGEEILTSYIMVQRPADVRQSELAKNWGFKCECETCCGVEWETHEKRRLRLYDMNQGLILLEKAGDNRRIYAAALKHQMIPTTDRDALRWAEESVELLKLEGLVGMDIAKAYRACSRYSLREGQLAKAMDYARKELDVQVICLGEDSTHMARDDDANVWIKHIEDMSEADKVRMRMNEKRVLKEEKRADKKAAKKAAKK